MALYYEGFPWTLFMFMGAILEVWALNNADKLGTLLYLWLPEEETD